MQFGAFTKSICDTFHFCVNGMSSARKKTTTLAFVLERGRMMVYHGGVKGKLYIAGRAYGKNHP